MIMLYYIYIYTRIRYVESTYEFIVRLYARSRYHLYMYVCTYVCTYDDDNNIIQTQVVYMLYMRRHYVYGARPVIASRE